MPILPVLKGQSASDDEQFHIEASARAGKSIPPFDLILQAIEQGYPCSFIDFPHNPVA